MGGGVECETNGNTGCDRWFCLGFDSGRNDIPVAYSCPQFGDRGDFDRSASKAALYPRRFYFNRTHCFWDGRAGRDNYCDSV